MNSLRPTRTVIVSHWPRTSVANWRGFCSPTSVRSNSGPNRAAGFWRSASIRNTARRGVASALLAEAVRRLRAAGVATVRTMVRRNNVPVLTFFRTNGFAGGPYVQLELVSDLIDRPSN